MLSPGLPLKESSEYYCGYSFWLCWGETETGAKQFRQNEEKHNILLFNMFFSWGSYKINQTQDKIGVFVSIVSTKIPFKGTGKEYIGDDISEIATAVKVEC